jgi:hypothetical protein
MPSLETFHLVLSYESLNLPELVPCVPEIVGHANRLKPDLRRHVLTIHMNMGRFAAVVTREVHIVGASE